MKRKGFRVLALTLAVMMLPMSAYAATSTTRTHSSSGGGGGGGGSSSSSSSGSVVSSGTATTTTTASVVESSVVTSDGSSLNLTYTTDDNKGNLTGLVYDETTSAGETIVKDSDGNAVSQGTAVSIPLGVAETNGLPESVVETINSINGGNLSAPGVDLSGYQAVTGTIPVFLKDAVTLEEVVRNTEINMYVASMPADGITAILFYNNFTQTWSLISPTSVDVAKNIVRFVVPCAGTTVMLTK
ncbi:MAG: hypothetical protein LUC94_11955 [Clostridiales bacterium]|nr:hypothetical protein [Clostridiales bacterium]